MEIRILSGATRNRTGHKDFQSFALPTELWHQFVVFCNRCFSFAVAKVRKVLEPANFLAEKERKSY